MARDRAGETEARLSLSDMSPEEFRRHGHDVVDWIAEYLQQVDSYPVLPSVKPGEVRRELDEVVKGGAEPFQRLLEDFDSTVIPGITHWNHPGFFAYFPTSASGPGILAEMLSAAVNVNAMVWKSSPAGTELEEHTLDLLRGLVGLPDGFFGTINDTASSSSLYALAAAREAALPTAREHGLFGAVPGRIYASEESHSSIDKAAVTLGFGLEGVRRIGTDDQFRMDPAALRQAVAADIGEGVRPVAIVATLGTTSTSSVDPVNDLADIAAEHDTWLHVDAAYAGPAAIVPELRHHFVGWERADSIVINPHKWLFTPIDCSVLYCRRPEQLRKAFSLTPEYLKTEEHETATNLMDYGLALGRRLRALKLWFVLRYFGSEGIADRLREHCRLAAGFASRVEHEAGWRVVAPVPFSMVAFRFCPTDDDGATDAADRINLAILERVNASGEVFMSHTRVNDRIVLRLCVANLRTKEAHVDRAWELLREAATTVV